MLQLFDFSLAFDEGYDRLQSLREKGILRSVWAGTYGLGVASIRMTANFVRASGSSVYSAVNKRAKSAEGGVLGFGSRIVVRVLDQSKKTILMVRA